MGGKQRKWNIWNGYDLGLYKDKDNHSQILQQGDSERSNIQIFFLIKTENLEKKT